MEKARKPYTFQNRVNAGFGATRESAPLPAMFHEYHPTNQPTFDGSQRIENGLSIGNERLISPESVKVTTKRLYSYASFCVMLIVSNCERNGNYLIYAGLKMTKDASIDSGILRHMLNRIANGESEVTVTGTYGAESVTYIIFRTMRGRLADMEFSPFGYAGIQRNSR